MSVKILELYTDTILFNDVKDRSFIYLFLIIINRITPFMTTRLNPYQEHLTYVAVYEYLISIEIHRCDKSIFTAVQKNKNVKTIMHAAIAVNTLETTFIFSFSRLPFAFQNL